ncbi:hypothetical protein OIU79_019142 [Salix purpurea]|uniref:Uncharacterized protein n=1 Tax=Salix purpurea TaxID=77065 RepID=A0A9Q0SJN4_SALPP|nr:hypothetical protein OIU79_019142 [Salix purpurea]
MSCQGNHTRSKDNEIMIRYIQVAHWSRSRLN